MSFSHPALEHHRLYAELCVAADLALEAGIMAKKLAGQVSVTQKADNTPVTEADLRADALISAGLQRAFPNDARLSEESGENRDLSDAQRVWVVDPIDGTRAFIKNRPGYSVMIGLLEDSIPTLGVVFDPVLGVLYYAVDGGGCWSLALANSHLERCWVSRSKTLQTLSLITTPSCPTKLRQRLLDQLGLKPGPIINSVGIKVGLMVSQQGDVYFSHHGLSYWDTVAPMAIAIEAGAKATGIDGSPLTYELTANTPRQHDQAVLYSNGPAHDELVERIAALIASVKTQSISPQ